MGWALRLSFVGSEVASVLLGVGLDLLDHLGSAMGAVSTERPIWAPGDPNPTKPSADTPEARVRTARNNRRMGQRGPMGITPSRSEAQRRASIHRYKEHYVK
ncbi:hypothetical protein N7527_011806 [Penicillium freii]|nr:hypothetical protein N7527_011806 [Penicillium freii]